MSSHGFGIEHAPPRWLSQSVSGALMVMLTFTIAGSDRLRDRLGGMDASMQWPAGAAGATYPVRLSLGASHAFSGVSDDGSAVPGRQGTALVVPDHTAEPVTNLVPMRVPVSLGRPLGDAVAAGMPAQAVGRASKLDGRFLRVNFDLAPASKDDVIYVSKPVVLNGAETIPVKMKITGGARVSVLGQDIAERLGRDLSSVGDEAGYVEISALRSLGLGVRYDAANDRVQLSSQAN